MARNTDTDTTGEVALLNPGSGGDLQNIQQDINDIFDTDGIAGENDVSAKDYSSTEVIADGDNRKVALEKLDAKFSATGHAHTGTSGDGAPISALNLTDINLFEAHIQTTTITGASGTSITVTTEFTGETSGGGDSAEGVITSAPNNRVEIRTQSNEEQIEDAGGQKVYARLTESGGTWTLSFYTNEAGVETAHSLSSTNLRIYYRKVFTLDTRPTVGSDVLNIGSLDLTADIVTATTALKGKVQLATATPADVASTGSAGTANGTVANADHVHKGLASIKKSGDAAIYGDAVLAAGSGVSLSEAGQTITISATVSSSGGGAGGSIQWSEGTAPPIATTNLGFDVYEWAPATAQGLLGNFKVPQSYTAGTQIFLYINFFANGTSNTVLFSTITTLIRSTDAVDSVTNQYTSTNSAQTLASPANRYFQVVLDLTSASGQINGVAVAAGDNLFFTLYRDGADTFTGNAYTLRPMPTEVKFS